MLEYIISFLIGICVLGLLYLICYLIGIPKEEKRKDKNESRFMRGLVKLFYVFLIGCIIFLGVIISTLIGSAIYSLF